MRRPPAADIPSEDVPDRLLGWTLPGGFQGATDWKVRGKQMAKRAKQTASPSAGLGDWAPAHLALLPEQFWDLVADLQASFFPQVTPVSGEKASSSTASFCARTLY